MPALGNFRLACKELENKILWYFVKEYFHEMKFMHSKFALEALVAVSKSRMALYVGTLVLGPASNDQGTVSFNGQQPKSPARREQILSALYHYAEENRTMRAFGHDAEMIQTAFHGLSSVTKVEFQGPRKECACISCSPLESYGERHLFESVGAGKASFVPSYLDASQSFARLLHITLSAAQSAGIQLEYVDARTTRFPQEHMEEIQKTGFRTYSLTFPSAPRGETASSSAFATLSTVKLCLGHHQDACNSERRTHFIRRLTTFFDRAPKLQTLGLTFQEGHGIFECLRMLTSSPSLRKIKRLELSSFQFDCMELFDILGPLQDTLQALELCNFVVDDWFEMLVWLVNRMTSLTELEFDRPQDFPTSAKFEGGNSIEVFYKETAAQWTKDRDEYIKSTLNSDSE
ncbi:hypothetical protein K458DRAFT_151736 [Lentithecium fluviatile CBS 122367]|uniref:F-box domain-containing protein n=1 Tax=Lentithecium fluviatile CBS 122367 TaxID=1168545 RepID=A0A6G1JE17_9PLEO|nr:hypothetical protein K458DRAFT_151736 [Lentithecium fluviatile CBS 122367]